MQNSSSEMLEGSSKLQNGSNELQNASELFLWGYMLSLLGIIDRLKASIDTLWESMLRGVFFAPLRLCEKLAFRFPLRTLCWSFFPKNKMHLNTRGTKTFTKNTKVLVFGDGQF